MNRRTLITRIFMFLVVGVSMVIGWKALKRKHWLSVLPTRLGVSRILYVAEESSGFGAGGNETGVVLYELPQQVAESIEARGIADVSGPDAKLTWRETPLTGPRVWFEGEGALPQTGPVPVPRLYNYLNQYGFGIPVDPSILTEIDRALSESGNKFAYTRTGVLLVMPKDRRVAFAFAG